MVDAMLADLGPTEGMADYEIEALARSYLTDAFEPDADQEAVIAKCIYENGLKSRQAVMDVLVVVLRTR